MSQMIDPGERIVTIEDAAELQLQQPHVVRLETRPANLEGKGEITMRDLVKNALRMRPDRIILGEIRGAEALDMLQAMNTGHDGSLSTIHANRPREALTRLENMVGMAGVNLPSRAIRQQIAAAVNLIVQISRMRDGIRRVTSVTEIVGMEGDVITTQDLFTYQFEGELHRRHAQGQLRVERPAAAFHAARRVFRARSRAARGGRVSVMVSVVYLFLIFILMLGVLITGWIGLMGFDQRGPLVKRAQKARDHFIGKPGEEEALTLKRDDEKSRLDELVGHFLPNTEHWRKMIGRTGTNLTLGKMAIFAVIFALAVGFGLWEIGVSLVLAVPAAIAGGLWMPRFVVKYLVNRRVTKFISVFPDAVGLMVRGLRAGLPVTETIHRRDPRDRRAGRLRVPPHRRPDPIGQAARGCVVGNRRAHRHARIHLHGDRVLDPARDRRQSRRDAR